MRVCAAAIVAAVIASLCVAFGFTLAPSASASSLGTGSPAKTGRALGLTGLAVAVDSGRRITLPGSCHSVAVGRSSRLAELLVTVRGGHAARAVKVGSATWPVPAGTTVSKTVWIAAPHGRVRTCLSGLVGTARMLAHATPVTTKSPGGLISITARVPLPTRGAKAGHWRLPPKAVPASAGGVILQVWSTAAGAVSVHAGSESVRVAVGKAVPAATLILRHGALSWERMSGRGMVGAMLLGYVTGVANTTADGARLHVLPHRLVLSGKSIDVAGQSGIPKANATVPPTGVLATVSGDDPSILDPLADGRSVTTATHRGQTAQTMLRLNDSGALRLSRHTTVSIAAYLSGDVVRAAKSIDLSQPGSPKLSRAPAAGVLTFAGDHRFAAGDSLVFGATRYTPQGLIAVATSVRHTTSATLVSYRIGGLLDAFRRLSLTTQLPTAPTSKRTSKAHRKADDITPVNTHHSLDFSAHKNLDLATSPPVSASISYDFAPVLTLVITINQGILDVPDGFDVYYALDTDTTLTTSVTVGAAWAGNATFTLGTSELGAFELGPVAVVPELGGQLYVSASANANVTVTTSIVEASHIGFNLHDTTPTADPNNSFGTPTLKTQPSANVGVSASAELTLTFTLAIEGVGGPDAAADITASANVTPGGSPPWQVSAEGDFKIGIDLNALDNTAVKDVLSLLQIPTNPSIAIGHLGPYRWSGQASGIGGSNGGGAGSGSTGGAGTTTPVGQPSLLQGSGRINISPCLNVHSGASGATRLLGCVPSGLVVTIQCTADGSSVTGPYGTTTLWDYITYAGTSGYVTDAYVYTGTAGPVAGTCASALVPAPPSQSGQGRINITPCLDFHTGPNGSAQRIGCIPDNTTVTIDCTAQGNTVIGPYGATTLWDHVTWNGQGGYVTDAYVYTGTNNAVAPACSAASRPSQPPAPSAYHAGRQVSIDTHATGGVSGHKGPSNSYATGPTHARDTAIWIVCYVNGQSITGPYGTTTIWDLGDDGYYYTDAWIYTGSNNPVVPQCTLKEVSVDTHATGGVSGHQGPANSYATGPTRPRNSGLTIVCYVSGQSITGPYGTTTIWDLGDDGYYYTDAWIYTGSNNPVVPHC